MHPLQKKLALLRMIGSKTSASFRRCGRVRPGAAGCLWRAFAVAARASSRMGRGIGQPHGFQRFRFGAQLDQLFVNDRLCSAFALVKNSISRRSSWTPFLVDPWHGRTPSDVARRGTIGPVRSRSRWWPLPRRLNAGSPDHLCSNKALASFGGSMTFRPNSSTSDLLGTRSQSLISDSWHSQASSANLLRQAT
jgi:hypothetical protein